MMTAHKWLTKELRLLYEYGEHTTFDKDAQRILAGLIAFSSKPPRSPLVEAVEKAGAEITYVSMDQEPQFCQVRFPDGAECGYQIINNGAICDWGHKQ
jgi:hypothetical protein